MSEGFRFSKTVDRLVELLGGPEGLSKLGAYGVENWSGGIMFRVNRGKLNLYVVMTIIPHDDEYLVLAQFTDKRVGLREVTASPETLLEVVEKLLKDGDE